MTDAADLRCITFERRDGVALISLDRPQRRNAIDRRLIAEVERVLDEIEIDDRVGAVLLRGAGPDFCAGFDLKDDATSAIRGAAAWRAVLEQDFDFLMRFWDYPKPTVAAVHGHCVAGGFVLALCCDLTVCDEEARFASPELSFGSVVANLILPWIAGPKAAKGILLSAETGICAERAERAGLVNRVFARGTLDAEAFALARRIARMDADAVCGTKAAINESLDLMGMRQALRRALDRAIAIEALDVPSRREFRERTREHGLREAIAWRDARLEDDAAGGPP